jgi:N-acetylneuraminic acid mutarotase
MERSMQILPIRRKSLVSKIAIAPALAANILRTQRVGLAMLCMLMSAAAFGQVTTQPGEWTWAGGNTHGSGAVWGTLGTPAAANIPGDRQNAAAWTDPSGNFWLFGGNGSDSLNNWGYLNDLWEYNLATNEWEWVSGSSTINCVAAGCFNPGVYGTLGTPSAGNIPGSREYGLSWIDSSGDLWLFGGLGYDAGGTFGILNDLWEFNPSTKLWTWVGGSTLESGAQIGVYGTVGTAASENIPGARSNAVSWTDTKGNFWLFGGGGYDSRGTNGTLNDVWEFNPSTSLWTWMGGSSTTWMSGVYGSLGTPAAGNIPGARAYAKSWTDGAGNFWLFGGMGFDGNYSFGYLDDLWQFNPSTNEWTWMGGNTKLGSTCQNTSGTTCGQIGMYGTLGTPSAGNMPGSRFDSAGWTDSAGNLWLFGGNGFDSTGAYGDLNELWEFNPFTGQWAWMGGSNTVGVNGGQPGIYGTLGTPAPGNIPGGRSSVETWTAMSGNLWLMGGCGFNASDGPDCLNDLWEYQPADTVASPAAATPTFNLTPGNYDTVQTLTISDTTSGATIYYSVNGTAPTINSPVYNGEITVSSPTTIEAIAVAGSHSNSAVATATYDVVAPTTATPSFSLSSGIYGAAQTVTLSDGTPEATIYYTTDGSTPTSSSNVYGGGILISSSATLKAMAAFAGYVNSPVATATYDITPLAANGTLQWTWMGGSGTTGSYCFTTSPGEPWQETTCGRAGVYGTLGTPAAGNLPGSRVSPATWTDSSGSLWLFGGAGYDVDGNEGILNDLWTFNPTTSLWTWMGGSSTGGQAGVYGTMGTPSAGNIPGGRYSPAVWTDRSGNVWLFGGGGAVDANGNSGYINDLWEYNPSTNLWAWMGGNSDGRQHRRRGGRLRDIGHAGGGKHPWRPELDRNLDGRKR